MVILVNFLVITFILVILYYFLHKRFFKNAEGMILSGFFFRVSLLFMILTLINPFFILNIVNHRNILELGAVGDWLGGSTAPFIGLASFIMILATYFTQKDELKHTKLSYETQTNLLEKQNRMIDIQRFEQTFFNLVSLHHDIVNSISFDLNGDSEINGRNVLHKIYLKLSKSLEYNETEDSINVRYRFINKGYEAWYIEHEMFIGHYIQNIFHLLNFIDRQNMSFENKYQYAKIVRAQFTNTELLILFYNTISRIEKRKFIEIMRKYKLFKYLNTEHLLHDKDKEIFEMNFHIEGKTQA
nr:putative phage abortive infection protein [Neobacillus sp. Marseille-Q6967]